MADITITRGNTLPDSSAKSDFHNLVDQATASLTNLAQADLASGSGLVIRSSSAPADTDAFWVDTSASPAVAKFHNGTTWTQVSGGGSVSDTFLLMGA